MENGKQLSSGSETQSGGQEDRAGVTADLGVGGVWARSSRGPGARRLPHTATTHGDSAQRPQVQKPHVPAGCAGRGDGGEPRIHRAELLARSPSSSCSSCPGPWAAGTLRGTGLPLCRGSLGAEGLAGLGPASLRGRGSGASYCCCCC